MKLTQEDIKKYGTVEEKNLLKEGKKSWYKDDKETFDIKLEIIANIEKYDKKDDPIEYLIFKGNKPYTIKAEVKEIWDEDDAVLIQKCHC